MANSTHPGAGLRVPGKGRVTERVVDEICRYIESEGLSPGDKLPPERVFVELFGVGRSSLREALRVLSATGLIEVVHGGGMYVSSTPQAATSGSKTLFDASEENALSNLVETRLGVEFAAVTALTRRGTDEDFASLLSLLDEQEARMSRDPGYTWEALSFELAISSMCGNSWLHDIELMLCEAWKSLSKGLRATVGRQSEWHSEHRAILASMRTGNVLQAQRLVMVHLSIERFEDDLADGAHRRGRRSRGAVGAKNSIHGL